MKTLTLNINHHIKWAQKTTFVEFCSSMQGLYKLSTLTKLLIISYYCTSKPVLEDGAHGVLLK